MNMTSKLEEKIEYEKWLILKDLYEIYLLTPDNESAVFEFIETPTNLYPSHENQFRIIKDFENTGILTIKRIGVVTPGSNDTDLMSGIIKIMPKGISFVFNKKKIKKLVLKYEEKYFKENNNHKYYITRIGGDFYYNGKLLDISKETYPYQVFNLLFTLIPKGGEISYKEFENELKNNLSKVKDYSAKEIRKFVLSNLTDKTNGFYHYSKINDIQPNGKSLISINRGKSIVFNNKAD